MSPFEFGVPSTLMIFLGRSSRLNGRRSRFAQFSLIKFSVAPESRRAVVLALLFSEWIKTRIVIDCRFVIYTRSELFALINADMIRRSENPAPLVGTWQPDCLFLPGTRLQ